MVRNCAPENPFPVTYQRRHGFRACASRTAHPGMTRLDRDYFARCLRRISAQLLRIGLRRHEAEIFAVPSHQINDAGVIDRIFAGRRRRQFRIKRLVGIGDFSNFLRRSGQADEALVKRPEIFAEHLGVAFGIDGDEDRLDAVSRGPERVERLRDRHQVGRAYIGTERVTEIDEHQLAAEVAIAARPACLIGQRERPADRAVAVHQVFHHLG